MNKGTRAGLTVDETTGFPPVGVERLIAGGNTTPPSAFCLAVTNAAKNYTWPPQKKKKKKRGENQ